MLISPEPMRRMSLKSLNDKGRLLAWVDDTMASKVESDERCGFKRKDRFSGDWNISWSPKLLSFIEYELQLVAAVVVVVVVVVSASSE